MIEEKHLILNDLDVLYLHRPTADPRASVIFIHGFPFSCHMWENQLNALPPDFEGFSYDIRGFGGSSTSHYFFSVDLFARDLLAFWEHLKIDNAILCGISMGGYIALRAFEIDPAAFAGIVLCDTNAQADGNEGRLKRFASIDLVQSGRKAEFASAFLGNVFCQSSLSKPEVIEPIRQTILKTSVNTICGTQLALASRTDTTAVLAKINAPALIVRGQLDKLATEEQAIQLHQGIINSDIAQIPEAAHLPNLENPIAFNQALKHYLLKHF